MERNIQLKSLNPYITCKICRGYLIDATTVTECLHTFCKSCLVKHLEENNTCPECEIVIHQSHPLQYISFDRTMQDIVYKVVPNLQESEFRRQANFYRSRGVASPTTLVGGETKPIEPDLQRFEEQVNVCLDLLDCRNGPMKPLNRRFVRCSALATITHLKKYIAKLTLDSTEKFTDIDVLCDDEVLGLGLTLKYVYVSRWRYRSPPLQLQYLPRVN